MRCYASGCSFRTDKAVGLGWREQLRVHSTDTGHELCQVCGWSLMRGEQRVCDQPRYGTSRNLEGLEETWEKTSCVTQIRELLSGVVVMWLETDVLLGRQQGQALPGADVLALIGPGGTGTAGRRLWPSELAKGLVQDLDGREHSVDNQPDDPASVVQLLTQWEDDWRRTRGEPAAPLPAAANARVLHATAEYLDRRMRWAAREDDVFEEFLSDLRALHARLEVATQRLRRATRANADCFDCKGPLIRKIDPDTGLEDEDEHGIAVFTCERCGVTYDHERYLLALRASYDTGLEGWVTVREAAAFTRRSTDTLKSWVARGLVESACRLLDRRQLVWWPDVHARTHRAQRRSRRSA